MINISETVKKTIVQTLECYPDIVHLHSDLKQDLGADSLDLIALMLTLEEVFDCNIATHELDNFHTVADIINYLETQLDEQS